VTWFVVQPPGDSVDAAVDGVRRYGELLART
jgi:hypothetical protein